MIVLSMSTDKPDINSAVPVFDHNDHSICVALDPEDHPFLAHYAGPGTFFQHVSGTIPVSLFHMCEPVLERLSGIGMSFPELTQRFPGNNSQAKLPESHDGIMHCSQKEQK